MNNSVILTVSEQRLYTETTTAWGLQELARERGLGFVRLDLEDFKARRWTCPEATLVVLHAAHIKIGCVTTDDIRAYWSRAKLISLGSDSLYYTRRYPDPSNHAGLLVDPRGYEFVGPELCDLHLDLMNEGVEAYAKVCPSDRWYWTASKKGLEIAKDIAKEPRPARGCDVICYANPRVSAPGQYRPRLTREMQRRGRSVQWGGTTEFVTLDANTLRDIFRLYRRSRVCLGTSSPSWPPYRAAKGFRDWLAPHLGLPLVYDDLPEATDGPFPIDGKIPIDTFQYEDWDGLVNLLNKYDDDHYLQEMVEKQQAWITQNTIECQFSRLFQKYGMLD